MTANRRSNIGIVGLVTGLVGWAGGILAVSTFLFVLRSSDSLLKTYISHYLGWFIVVPLVAFVFGNVGATIFGSIGYAARTVGDAPRRTVAYSRSAMILGSAGLLSGTALLLFALARELF